MNQALDNQQGSPEPGRFCKKCKTIYPIDNFATFSIERKRQRVTYRRHQCDDCRRKYQAAWARGDINPVDLNAPERECRKCGETKPIEDFAKVYSKNSRGKNYWSHTCLDCTRRHHAAKEKLRRRNNPDKFKKAERKNYRKHRDKKLAARREADGHLRDAVFKEYGGYICGCCGETEKSMLTLDHVNEDGGKHRSENKGHSTGRGLYNWIIEQGFPADIQVLCYNCNISKFRNGGVCAHRLKEPSTTIP